jgi:hypothetical protein
MIAAVLPWLVAAAVFVVSPAYPPNAVSGGTVVAVMHVSSGEVRGVDILQGDAPFQAPVRAALAGWRFENTRSGDVLAVAVFRTPNLYSTGSPDRELTGTRTATGLAFPTRVVEPAYPANSLGEGAVVLRLALSDAGAVTKVETIQGLGDLTAPCVAAAGKWQFSPGRTARGSQVATEAYAICVMRRPVLPVKKTD